MTKFVSSFFVFSFVSWMCNKTVISFVFSLINLFFNQIYFYCQIKNEDEEEEEEEEEVSKRQENADS